MKKSFEIIERAGVSTDSFSDAVKGIVLEAHSERPVSFFKVTDWRGRVDEQGNMEYQVIVQIGRKF